MFSTRTLAKLAGTLVLICLIALVTQRGALTPAGQKKYPCPDCGDVTMGVWEQYVSVNPAAKFPNQDRSARDHERETRIDSGTRSQHYGEIQRERCQWLLNKAKEIRFADSPDTGRRDIGDDKAAEPDGIKGKKTLVPASDAADPEMNIPHGMKPGGEEDAGGAMRGLQRLRKRSLSSRKEMAVGSVIEALKANSLRQAGRPSRVQETGKPSTTTRFSASRTAPAETFARGARDNPLAHRRASAESKESRNAEAEKTTLLVTSVHSDPRTGEDRGRVDDSPKTKRQLEAEKQKEEDGGNYSREERALHMEEGADIWMATYVPPIEPARRQYLIDKWSRGDGGTDAVERPGKGSGRILYVISSFDRGARLGTQFRHVDKMNYVLMMMDEMREACEVGFTPQIHLIAAWDVSKVSTLIRDRLFCERIGDYLPYSFESHPPEVNNELAIKHRIFMKSRLEDFDVFLQVEDDMIITLNHILLYVELSDKLAYRRHGTPEFSYMPGFIRIEPEAGMGMKGSGEEWFEWEIILSRFRPTRLTGAGTYIALSGSTVLERGGNNQGLWMATQAQLRHLNRKCRYLENINRAHVETHSGSIQMFQMCGIKKVFPATEFEGFLVHHRTNNKNGRRGESIPAVPISLIRMMADQFLRDSSLLRATD